MSRHKRSNRQRQKASPGVSFSARSQGFEHCGREDVWTLAPPHRHQPSTFSLCSRTAVMTACAAMNNVDRACVPSTNWAFGASALRAPDKAVHGNAPRQSRATGTRRPPGTRQDPAWPRAERERCLPHGLVLVPSTSGTSVISVSGGRCASRHQRRSGALAMARSQDLLAHVVSADREALV